MKTYFFQSCGHCWVFQICWHIECSTFTASSLRIWNSSTGIPSPPLALFIVMLSKAHLTVHSRMSGSRWLIPPSWLSGMIIKTFWIYALTSNAEEAEVEWFYEDLQDLLELKLKKDVLFIIGNWDVKVGSQEIPGVTGKFGLGVQNEAGQRPIEFCQENALVIANSLFQKHKRRLYTWTSAHGQYQNQIDYILCGHRWRSSIQSAKTRLGVDCGSDHELNLVHTRTQAIGAVTPQETDPDLPMSVQESPAEAWVGVACCRVGGHWV